MKVFHDIPGIICKRPVATIGIFDGVHLAHQAIINRLTDTAEQMAGESVIVTMWPHPRIVLRKGEDIKLLSTLDEKIERLEHSGVDNLIILPFTKMFASTSFEEFVRDILVNKIGIVHLVVGYNHQFGHNREGNYAKLQQLGNDYGFSLSQQDPVVVDNEKVSSSNIRHLLQSGHIEKSNRFLGYHFFLKGKVVKGKELGQKIGFPTANLEVNDTNKIIPKNGVYAVLVELEGRVYQGMMNIGCRPTIERECTNTVLEVNLLNFEGDLYQKELRVYFINRVRDEKKFNTLEELAAQIMQDRELIKNILGLVKIENRKLVI